MAQYKKPSKIVEETYLKNRQKEIPLYDPQTGEINLQYEKITGKPNPLLDLKKEDDITKRGAETISKEIRKNIDYIPHDFDYKKSNRFLVHFPKEFGISPFQIDNVITPSIETTRKHLLRFHVITRTNITDAIITVRELDNSSVMGILINKMENKFNFSIELVNPQNIVIEKWLMNNCFINQLSTNQLSYKNDNVLKTIINVSVGNLVIK